LRTGPTGLQLRDRIAFIEDQITPDIIA